MLWSSLINLATLAVAEAHLNVHYGHLEVRDATLQVILEPALSGRVAEVSATIKNSGTSNLNLLKVGTILDDELPVQRVIIVDDLALVERTNLQPGCNETAQDASTKGLSKCQALALAAAADAADPASKRFVEYVKTNSSEARDVVVARFRSVAAECGTTGTGVSRYFCYDYYGICEIEGPPNAYTLWQFDTVVMCPLFYGLPPLPAGCHRQCQATTTIHEITHCEGIYAPHTNDYAYAYNASVVLPLERALLNVDNYSLYAN
ncbi:Neutral protease 2-like protein, partial [Colletotrichum shisoi]